MNKQRETIYSQRREILQSDSIKDWILSIIEEVCENIVETSCGEAKEVDEESFKEAISKFQEVFAFTPQIEEGLASPQKLAEAFKKEALKRYEEREKQLGEEILRSLEKYFLLTTIDTLWKDHLLTLDHLKESVGLRGYGQKDPLQEYKREAFHYFMDLMQRIKETTLSYLYRVEVREEAPEELQMEGPSSQKLEYKKEDVFEEKEEKATQKQRPVRVKKVGRNDPCPCGSGKKYKKCCGRKENFKGEESEMPKV
jgi:preprotein translocase subunit SecA